MLGLLCYSKMQQKAAWLDHRATKSAFNNLFRTEDEPVEYVGYTTRITPSESNVYVHQCSFVNISSETAGGAIGCKESVLKLLVAQTSFALCTTCDYCSGAIDFDNVNNGQCFLREICGYQCTTKQSQYTHGQFSALKVKDDPDFFNQVNDTTIAGGRIMDNIVSMPLDLVNGQASCRSVNISNNEVSSYSALSTTPYRKEGKSPDAVTGFYSYTTIANNTAKESRCISLGTSGSTQSIYACNIINNEQENSLYGLIQASAQVYINNTCIINNNAWKCLFYEDEKTCGIILTNCTFDDDLITETSARYKGGFTIESTIKSSFTNVLTHIITANCDSVVKPDSGDASKKSFAPIEIVGITISSLIVVFIVIGVVVLCIRKKSEKEAAVISNDSLVKGSNYNLYSMENH